MAAGKFFMFREGWRSVVAGNISLESGTIKAYPVHYGYTPNTASHSALADIAAFQATASGSVVAAVTLGNVAVTVSGANVVKLDWDDIGGFSAGGDTFHAKYMVAVAQSASRGGIDNLVVGFIDLDTGSTTGIEAAQINLTGPANGWYKDNCNS